MVRIDKTPPAIHCPAAVLAECTGNLSASLDPGRATATDTCSNVSVSVPGRSTFPLGSTDVPYVARDEAANSATCSTRVTVADTRAPMVSAAFIRDPSERRVFRSHCTAADTCDPTPQVRGYIALPNLGSCVPVFGSGGRENEHGHEQTPAAEMRISIEQNWERCLIHVRGAEGRTLWQNLVRDLDGHVIGVGVSRRARGSRSAMREKDAAASSRSGA